jgi:DNA-binding PadR family transcriptional regulator
MVVLGLLIERPDTLTNIKAQLGERFPHGRWSDSSAYYALDSLEKAGHARMAKKGQERGLDLYEATPDGAQHFREWLRESSLVLPALRDARRARLEFAGEDDMPAMCDAIRKEEQFCKAEFLDAQQRLGRAREEGCFGPSDGSSWKGRKRSAMLTDDVMLWGQRALRLKRLREGLEPVRDLDQADEDL